MTGDQVLGLALIACPLLGAGWAWIQWQREEARRLSDASDQLRARAAAVHARLGAEPDVDREDPTPGQWVRPPWPTRELPMRPPELRREAPPDTSWVTTEQVLGRVAPYPPVYDKPAIPFTKPKLTRTWH